MVNKIGIMCGRLSKPVQKQIQAFPIYSWKKEFEKASKCGFELIEWVFDLRKNPIMTKDGINEIKHLSKRNKVIVKSVCADYFMIKRLFNVSDVELGKNLSVLKDLIVNCNKLDIELLEIPLVDSSSIKKLDDTNQLISNLEPILRKAEENNVKLVLETDLPPNLFKLLINRINHPNIMAIYDIGNSTSLGYDIKTELKTLAPWLVNVHVKDRILHGPTVPLGTGDVDFRLFFSTLKEINYQGDFIIQGAREDLVNKNIRPEDICKKYFKFVKQYVDKWFTVS